MSDSRRGRRLLGGTAVATIGLLLAACSSITTADGGWPATFGANVCAAYDDIAAGQQSYGDAIQARDDGHASDSATQAKAAGDAAARALDELDAAGEWEPGSELATALRDAATALHDAAANIDGSVEAMHRTSGAMARAAAAERNLRDRGQYPCGR